MRPRSFGRLLPFVQLLAATALIASTARSETLATNFGDRRQLVLGDISGVRVAADGLSYVGPLGLSFARDSATNFRGVGNNVSRTMRFWFAPSADYFVMDRFSVGVSIAFSVTSGAIDIPVNANATQTFDLPTTTGFSFSTRAGYALPLGERTALWGRAGLGYKTEQWVIETGTPQIGATARFSSAFMTLEALFLLRVSQTVFFSGGPELSVSLGGSQSETVGARELAGSGSRFDFGLRSGIGVLLNL